MDMVKGLLLGAVLTYAVSLVIGSQGSTGGFLRIHDIGVGTVHVWWSWPLFLAAGGISWGILTMMK